MFKSLPVTMLDITGLGAASLGDSEFLQEAVECPKLGDIIIVYAFGEDGCRECPFWGRTIKDEDGKLWNQCSYEPPPKPVIKHKCPFCQGEGVKKTLKSGDLRFTFQPGVDDIQDSPCSFCEGTGSLESEAKTPIQCA